MNKDTSPPSETRWVAIRNDRDQALTVVLEPWAVEYPLLAGETIEIAEDGGDPRERLEIHIESSSIVLYARSDSLLRAFQNGRELP